MTTDTPTGALYRAVNTMDPVVLIDATTPVEFTTRLSTERPRRWRVQRAQHPTNARACITGPEPTLRAHLAELSALTLDDLIGEEDVSPKLPRGLHIQLVELNDIDSPLG